MRLLYNIIFPLFFLLSAPFYFLKMWRRGGWTRGFGQRFGRYDTRLRQSVTNRHVLWLHAVSVGEVNLCTQLIAALEPRLPNLKFVVSTTTTTGMAELRKRLPQRITRIYYPVDLPGPTRRAARTFHTVGVVLIEAEIWPNFLWHQRDYRVPVFLVNARLSEKSYRGYRRLSWLFRPLFASLAGVGAQNETDAQRLRELGCRPEAIHVVGSLKFDAPAALEGGAGINVGALLRMLQVPADAPILVAGSTHAGEEALLAEQFLRLRRKHPHLFLLLVPRHSERCPAVAAELDHLGIRHCFRTELAGTREFRPGEIECLIVNSTGELRAFYQPATVVFVGKSLTAEGGQNPIEPAALGKAIVFGPNMQNFAAIAEAFVRRGGAVQVRSAAELEQALDELLTDADRRAALGRAALEVVRENRGALERTVEMIVRRLNHQGQYVAPTP
jgi:3-deoxy-D-manno-octulosonic-acid transferase